MKSVAAFAALMGFVFAINAVGGGVYLALGKMILAAWPGAREEGWPWIASGLIAVAASVWFAFAVMRISARLARRRRRDPASGRA